MDQSVSRLGVRAKPWLPMRFGSEAKYREDGWIDGSHHPIKKADSSEVGFLPRHNMSNEISDCPDFCIR